MANSFKICSSRQRSFIEAEEAEQLLEPLSEPGNPYTKICFSNKSFGIKAARVAAPILSSIKHQLEQVDFSDIVAGRPTAEALDVFSLLSEALEGSNLTSLSLSDNALGEKGVRAFGKLLKSQTRLEELYLRNAGLSKEAAQAVCELVTQTDKLRVLEFHKNLTGLGYKAISQLVKRSPGLEVFECSASSISSKGCIELAEALNVCTQLRKLDLSLNSFRWEDGIKLSEAILHFDHLAELNLSYLNLKDVGAVAIAGALKSSGHSLRVLDVSGNYVTAHGARAIAMSVVNKPDFELLKIDDNIISGEGIDELREIFAEFPEKLGALDDNDPGGYIDDDEDESCGDELVSMLEKLDVNKEEE